MHEIDRQITDAEDRTLALLLELVAPRRSDPREQFVLPEWLGPLREPLLYLSLHFKLHRARYYELLQRVRTEGIWDEWVDFFLEGVVSVSTQAVEAACRIRTLFETDRERIKLLWRPASSALRLHEHLQRHPYTTIQQAASELGLSAPTVATAVKNLEKLGIVREISGRDWRRLFAYVSYFAIISADSEPLPA